MPITDETLDDLATALIPTLTHISNIGYGPKPPRALCTFGDRKHLAAGHLWGRYFDQTGERIITEHHRTCAGHHSQLFNQWKTGHLTHLAGLEIVALAPNLRPL